jgi:hypothetical protein
MSKKRDEMLKMIRTETAIWAAVAMSQEQIHTYVNAVPTDATSFTAGAKQLNPSV